MIIEFEKRILALCKRLDELLDYEPENKIEIAKIEARISEARSLFAFFKEQKKQEEAKKQYREG